MQKKKLSDIANENSKLITHYGLINDLSVFKGLTFKIVYKHTDECIFFVTEDDELIINDHLQDCCEDVVIEDIVGDLNDLVGSPILLAEESSSRDVTSEEDAVTPSMQDYLKSRDNSNMYYVSDSNTWTFYKFATVKGYVDIRWHGSSNGYYSEKSSFLLVDDHRKVYYYLKSVFKDKMPESMAEFIEFLKELSDKANKA